MDIDLSALVSQEGSFGVFLLITLVLGGGAAWLSGRAIAGTWRPWWQLPAYMLILGGAVRFIHFALFGGTFLSPYFYAVDAAVCLVFSALGFRLTRARQMTEQYPWIYIRNGPFGWRRREAPGGGSKT